MFKQRFLASSLLGLSMFMLPLLSAEAMADTAAHRALAEDVLKITRANTVLDGMTGHMRNMFAQAVQSMNVPPEKKAIVDEYSKRLGDILTHEMDWNRMKGQFVDVYTAVFTEQELKDLIGFYESPLGQKMIAKMPELMQQSMQIGQQQMRTVLPKVQELAQEMSAKLKEVDAKQ